MRPEVALTIRNGPNSTPVSGRLEVNGRIRGTSKGYVDFEVRSSGGKRAEKTIWFRGTVTAFEFDGEGAVILNGKQTPARNIEGFDTRSVDAIAGGDPDGEPAPDPRDPPEDAPDESGVNPIAKDEALGGGAFMEIPKGQQDPQNGVVSRYIQTTEPIHLTVDENDGGAIQDAFNRIPMIHHHPVMISGPAGRYSGNGSAIHTGPIFVMPPAKFTFGGEVEDRSRFISESGINATFGGKQEHIGVSDATFKNLSQFSGPVFARNAAFEGFNKPGANAKSTAAISGKNGRLFMKNCRIGKPEDDYGIHSTLMEWYAVFGTTFKASKAAVRQPDSSMITVGWGCDADGVRFTSDHKNADRGSYLGGKKFV